MDQFYFNGSIGCVSTNNQIDFNNCLNFGSVSILSSIEEIESLIGKPYTTVKKEGTDYFIYLIPSDLETSPYLAVSLNENGYLNTIQLTGDKSFDNFAFSGIRLGDYFTMVENRLGKPSSIQSLDEQTEIWSYYPHHISIEIKDKLVYSIKLRRI